MFFLSIFFYKFIIYLFLIKKCLAPYILYKLLSIFYICNLFLFLTCIITFLCTYNIFFKMLIILYTLLVSSPCKPMLCEKLIGQVVMIYFIREFFAPVNICFGISWLNIFTLIGYIGIIKRININC